MCRWFKLDDKPVDEDDDERAHKRAIAASAAFLALLNKHHGLPPAGETLPEPIRVEIVERERGDDEPVMITHVKKAVCRYFDITRVELEGHRRFGALVYARQIAMYLSANMTERGMVYVGHQFGWRDHTTVVCAVKKIGRLVRLDWKVAYDVARLEQLI
jgi:chromosomal replication initiator protein